MKPSARQDDDSSDDHEAALRARRRSLHRESRGNRQDEKCSGGSKRIQLPRGEIRPDART